MGLQIHKIGYKFESADAKHAVTIDTALLRSIQYGGRLATANYLLCLLPIQSQYSKVCPVLQQNFFLKLRFKNCISISAIYRVRTCANNILKNSVTCMCTQKLETYVLTQTYQYKFDQINYIACISLRKKSTKFSMFKIFVLQR